MTVYINTLTKYISNYKGHYSLNNKVTTFIESPKLLLGKYNEILPLKK